MRWWLLILLLCIPFAQAKESWYYAGDTFEIDDTLYAVEGSHPDNVLFSVDGRSYIIAKGECIKQGLSEYCYLKSAYPSDDDHIRYVAGERLYGYYMGINEIKPKVSVSRVTSAPTPVLGQEFDITVTIENTGEYAVNQFTYLEAMPAGLKLRNYPSNKVNYTMKTLSPDEEVRFTYTVEPVDYVNAQLQPNATYLFEGASFSSKVSPLTVTVDTPLVINRTMTNKIALGQPGSYVLNITNKDGEESMRVQVNVKPPQSWLNVQQNYTEEITIKPGETESLELEFYPTAAGAFKMPVEIIATIHGTPFKRYYDEAFTVSAEKLVPTLKLSTTRTSFIPGEKLAITALLQNADKSIGYTEVSGVLSAPGLFAAKSFNNSLFPPNKTITEAEIIAVMPAVEQNTTFTITFTGKYSTPTGGIYDFVAKKSITVSPLAQPVQITQKVEPINPLSGTNVTVTVSVKNTYGKYITLSAADAAPWKAASGLMYAETSLDRDQSRTLYTYKLEIPNYYNESFNITTTVDVKDAETQEAVTTVYVNGTPPAPEQEVAEEVAEVEQKEESKEELGFWASMWDFLTGLF